MKLLGHASGSWFGRGFDHGRQQGNSLTVCFRRYHLKMSSQRRVKAVGTRHFDGNSITQHGIQPLYVGMRSSSSMNRQEPATVETFLRSDTLTSDEDKDLSKRQYPFENLVFEGGGTKGIAYAGVMKVLMDVGVWPNIKRFGGTSVGAMIACMLAVDYSPNKVVEMMDKELGPIAVDHSFGILSLLPNLIRHYGWNPGKKLLDWFGDKLAEKTGNRDITFKELYDQYGKELCIVVCNVTQMNAEYCHVKTTPDMPIRLAVRMSMSIPGFYQAVKSTLGANESVYVDGGVLVNYPVHCYDGWWLSLNSDDSFLVRLQPLSHIHKMWNKKRRFGEFNEKTLGVLLCSESEPEIFEGLILGENDTKIPRPDTKLARKRGEIERTRDELDREHTLVSEAMCKFLSVLASSNLDQNRTISKAELTEAFKNTTEFTADHAKTLFGDISDVNVVFDKLDINDDGQISFNELRRFAEKKGIDLESQFIGYDRKHINGLAEFLDMLKETILINLKRLYITHRDIDRTVAVDVDYLSALDFDMEEDDKVFAVKQGAVAAKRFLKHYVTKYDPPMKADSSK